MIRKTPDVADLHGLRSAAAWHAKIASQIEQARTALGLSRKELAQRVGTKESTIARFEDSNYRGHSLSILERIAASMGLRLLIELTGDEDTEAEDAAAADWLKSSAPSHEAMVKWARTSEIPPETDNDTDDTPPW